MTDRVHCTKRRRNGHPVIETEGFDVNAGLVELRAALSQTAKFDLYHWCRAVEILAKWPDELLHLAKDYIKETSKGWEGNRPFGRMYPFPLPWLGIRFINLKNEIGSGAPNPRACVPPYRRGKPNHRDYWMPLSWILEKNFGDQYMRQLMRMVQEGCYVGLVEDSLKHPVREVITSCCRALQKHALDQFGEEIDYRNLSLILHGDHDGSYPLEMQGKSTATYLVVEKGWVRAVRTKKLLEVEHNKISKRPDPPEPPETNVHEHVARMGRRWLGLEVGPMCLKEALIWRTLPNGRTKVSRPDWVNSSHIDWETPPGRTRPTPVISFGYPVR